jgi:hypothetical protein
MSDAAGMDIQISAAGEPRRGGGWRCGGERTVKERRRCRRISGSEDGEQGGRAGKRVKKMAERSSGLVIRFSSCAERGTS